MVESNVQLENEK